MRYRCDYCQKEVDVSEPVFGAQGVGLQCPACGQLTWLSGAKGPAPAAPPKPAPKPAPAQPPRPKVDLRKTPVPAEPPALRDPARAPVLRQGQQLWKALQDRYQEQTAHTQFIEAASQLEILDFAAWRYREHLAAAGEDDVSRWALDRLLNVAAARYLAAHGPAVQKNTSIQRYVILALMLVVLLAIVYYFTQSMPLRRLTELVTGQRGVVE